MTPKPPPACLLIHGFTGSPKEMEGLAQFLAVKGCAVRLPLLPGHGSQPDALRRVRARDWLHAVEAEYRAMAANASALFAIGLSMGATLALHLAANFRMDGVVALAPALHLPLWQQAAAFVLSPLVRWRHKATGPDVNDATARLLLSSYDCYPTASVNELVRTMRLVRRELHRVTAPLLIMHGKLDRTMSLKNVEMLQRAVCSQNIRIKLLDHSAHVVTVDYDHKEVFSTVWNFVSANRRSQESMPHY